MLKHLKLDSRLLHLFAMCLAWPSMSHAQVQFFDRVPTQQEIHEALNGSRAGDAPAPTDANPRFKTRGIEWNAPEPTASVSKAPPQTGGSALAFPVKFDTGATRVSAASLAYIDAIAQALQRNPEMRLTIEGHTDAPGNPRANVMLSWERAFSVFRVMVDKHGIDPTRLQPAGKGALEPLVPTDQPHPMNRRVQFRLMNHG